MRSSSTITEGRISGTFYTYAHLMFEPIFDSTCGVGVGLPMFLGRQMVACVRPSQGDSDKTNNLYSAYLLWILPEPCRGSCGSPAGGPLSTLSAPREVEENGEHRFQKHISVVPTTRSRFLLLGGQTEAEEKSGLGCNHGV